MRTKIKQLLRTDWFLCVLLTLLVMAGMFLEFYPLQAMERQFYDWMASHRHKELSSPVVVVAIDDASIQETGSWPWPRSRIADMVSRLSKARAKVIGIDLLYPSEELNQGLQEVRKLRKNIQKNAGPLDKRTISRVNNMLGRVEKSLNGDAKLIASVRSAKKVVLPMLLIPGADKEKPAPIPQSLKKQSLRFDSGAAWSSTLYNMLLAPELPAAGDINSPFTNLTKAAWAVGHSNFFADSDGTVRRQSLLVPYQGKLFPSFSMQLALAYYRTNHKRLRKGDGSQWFNGLAAGRLRVPTDSDHRMLIDFNGEHQNFKKYSFSKVARNKIRAKAFRNKVVLIGVTATGLSPLYDTPVRYGIPGVEMAASSLANILTNTHITRPSWGWLLELGVFIYLFVFLLLIIPKVNGQIGAIILALFLAIWYGGSFFLFLHSGYWLKVFSPSVLAVLSFTAIMVNRNITVSQQHDENTETNKMLGVSFQSQGMLDMAFEKFMKCPISNISVKDLLYNLGLDFERKRMFNKAVAVYQHINKAGNFKDTKERIKRFKNVGTTVRIGSGAVGDATMLLSDTEAKPTLGRYEIIKELGQGAMGTVYLGRDPKINREVAIKTLLYRDIDENQVHEVKERFFREAEAAGKLSHTNIVTIYDAGEEYDMAYMAMELLSGDNLTPYCRKDNLLPPRKILRILIGVAEALEYAHKYDVVHRDIKPANIMLLENGHVKVADFGIARMMAASMTQTGVVIGTPNYMSPEQVAGKKVDGRSDLFSLGAVFYELLTSEKPFQSESIGALMYNIANVTYTPLLEIDPDIPECCAQIVTNLMTKTVSRRFKNATELITALNQCLRESG